MGEDIRQLGCRCGLLFAALAWHPLQKYRLRRTILTWCHVFVPRISVCYHALGKG